MFNDVGTSFWPPDADLTSSAKQLGVGISFKIVTHSEGSFWHDGLCSIYREANATVGGYRASRIPPSTFHIWHLATSATIYQVDYSLPGDRSPILQTVTPTPVPEATRTAAQVQAEAILATFRPIPATPPKC